MLPRPGRGYAARVDRPTTIDEYIAAQAPEIRPRVAELRALVRAHAPGAVESIKWGSPAFSGRTIYVMLSAHARHCNVAFTPSTREAFAAELTGLRTGKGTVQVPHDEPVPADLLGRMIEYRAVECEQRGVNWM